MISSCNNFVLSFNGEIYNFKEIKNWINGPKIVAEFADSSITYIEEFMSKIEVDYLSINYSSKIIKKIDYS